MTPHTQDLASARPARRGPRHATLALALTVIGLVACGGGGGGGSGSSGGSSPVASDDDGGAAPAAAWDSPQAFTTFVAGLHAEDEAAEPMSMDGMDLPPTSETDEPVPWV